MPISSPYPVTHHERVAPSEERAVTEVLTIVRERMHELYPDGQLVRRDAHPKHHGVVRATLEVEPGLPGEYRVGVFASKRSYPAWVRFSNGSGEAQSDTVPDARGVAIKLLGVRGEKLLDDEADASTQDFLLINHDVFFVKDVSDYVAFFRASIRDKAPLKFFFGTNPFRWHLRELMIAKELRTRIANPLEARYWSTVPILMGNRPAKVSIRPSILPSSKLPIKPGPDYLREQMCSRLSSTEVSFDFLVQLQGDPGEMPVEDPRIRWAEERAPFRKVATLRIPAQQFESPQQMAFAENLSYTPWHCLPEHRPLGGVNRCRFSVYREISRMRHASNSVARIEPNGNESF